MARTKHTQAIAKRFDYAMREIIEKQKRENGHITSVRQFAISIGKKPNNMFNLDRRDCTVDEIDKIYRLYNVNPTWLISGKGEMFLEEIDAKQLAEQFTRLVLNKYRNGRALKKKATH